MSETNKPFKVIAFDLDGTLVNSLPDLALSVCQAFAEFNLPQPQNVDVLPWIGNGADILLQRAIEWSGAELNKDSLAKIKERFSYYYGQNVCNKSELYPGVKETLDKLKAAGYALAVVTNKPTIHVAPVLEAFGIAKYFSQTLGGQSLPAIKPHPAPLFYLCGVFGVYPHEILFVGDSRNDILAARNAGCKVVGLTFGYNYNEPIAESNPDWVFDNFSELLTITN